MVDYYLGKKNMMIPFSAENDSDACKVARTLVKGTNYFGFLILNNETGHIFDLYGDTA